MRLQSDDPFLIETSKSPFKFKLKEEVRELTYLATDDKVIFLRSNNDLIWKIHVKLIG